MTTTQKKKNRKALRDGSYPTEDSHLDFPAGYHLDDKIATLREVIDPSIPTKSLAELTQDQRIDLVVERWKQRPEDFSVVMIGPGPINKARALAEIGARSGIGRSLVEVEQHLLMRLAQTQERPK